MNKRKVHNNAVDNIYKFCEAHLKKKEYGLYYIAKYSGCILNSNVLQSLINKVCIYNDMF